MNPLLGSMTPGVKYVILRVTNKCNASCSYCLNGFYRPEDPAEAKPAGDLSVAEYGRIAKNLKGLVLLNLSGGEPHVREDLPDIAAQFIVHAGASLISSPTNGSFPARVERFARRLLGEYRDILLKIDISFDGIGEEHNAARGLKRGYEDALESAKRLLFLKRKFRNLIVNSNTVANRSNIHSLDGTLAHLSGTALFDENHLTLVRAPGTSAELTDQEFELFRRSYQKLLDGEATAGFRGLMARSVSKVMLATLEESVAKRENRFNCVAGEKLINIDNVGQVSICEILAGPPLGNLREHDYSVRKILSLAQTKARLSKLRERPCSNCHWECAISGSLFFESAGRMKLGKALISEAISSLK